MEKDKSTRPSCSYWWKRHNWEYINKYEIDSFMGEAVKRSYIAYRRCLECGVVQTNTWCSHGSYWETLSSGECDIFNDKITVGTTEIRA